MKTLIAILLALFCITTANAVEWTKISSPNNNNSLVINEIKCHKDGKLYAATDSGLFVFNNDSISWNKLIVPNYEDSSFQSIHFNSSGHIFCKVQNERILRTTDMGKSWIEIYKISCNEVPKCSITGFHVNKKGNLFIIDRNITANSLKLLHSTDNGDSWNIIENYRFLNNCDECEADLFMTGKSNSIYYLFSDAKSSLTILSSPDGVSGWVDNTNDVTRRFKFTNDINDEIYVGTGTNKPALFKYNGIDTVTLIDLSKTNYLSFSAFKAVDTIILVATNKDVMYLSADNGETFQLYSLGTKNNTIRSFSYDILGYYYCITNEGIYRSTKPIQKEPFSLPTLTTTAVTTITNNTASSGGNITGNGNLPITAQGVCWSTTEHPTISNDTTCEILSNVGSYTSRLENLSQNTKYYVRAYATNSLGTGYGEELNFTTVKSFATLSTDTIISITSNSAKSGGKIFDDGGSKIIERGVCWSTSQFPDINNDTTSDTGTSSYPSSYTSNITKLNHNTTYYVRAYATNSAGTAYGDQRMFITLPEIPKLKTREVTNITDNSANTGGDDLDDGGSNITEKGVCWSTSPNPVIDNPNNQKKGTGSNSYPCNITGLIHNTTYYVRAYATNSLGTSYGECLSFKTKISVPKLLSPINSASKVSLSPTFTWNIVSKFSNYEINVISKDGKDFRQPTVTDSKKVIAGLNEFTLYKWKVRAVSDADTSDWSEEWSFTTDGGTSVEDDTSKFNTDFNISPNPATDNISISFSNSELSNPSISIFNSLGIEMKYKLSDGSSINISTKEFPSGIYYCTLNSGMNRITKSFMVVK
jgi:hypothetical protein